MRQTVTYVVLVLMAGVCGLALPAQGSAFRLALASHAGQLHWDADGFTIVESSAKPGGVEIGIRGKDGAGRLAFLGFLFLVPAEAPLTSAKCRDGALGSDRKDNPTLKIQSTSENIGASNPPVTVVTYTVQGRDQKTSYMVRGLVATGDICGDLEFYSDTPITGEDSEISTIFRTYRFDPNYLPQFDDVFAYAQILYQHNNFKAAAPIFEQALSKIADDKNTVTMRRVATDQAGMSYGMSGNVPKARTLFEAAIAKDPDYPLYYYNLACADAEENKLADARLHLQEAFARRSNVIPGETMPDPAKDDSFLPHRDDQDFWKFIESLH